MVVHPLSSISLAPAYFLSKISIFTSYTPGFAVNAAQLKLLSNVSVLACQSSPHVSHFI
jgi:hypothetical protein